MVTIVVLLTLAGITSYMVFSDNGILKSAKDAADKDKLLESEEQKLIDALNEFWGASNKKVAIRLINSNGNILSYASLNVYTDEACQNFLKTIDITPNSSSNPGYSYESDDILTNGTYYIKMTSAPNGYNMNDNIFKYEVTDSKNVLTIILNLSVALPSSGYGVGASGNGITLSDMMHVTIQPSTEPENFSTFSAQVYLEPIAEYNESSRKVCLFKEIC